MSDYKDIEYVDVEGDNPNWVLRFQKSTYQEEEVVFRFAWRKNGGQPMYNVNASLPLYMIFKALAAAAKKGMIE